MMTKLKDCPLCGAKAEEFESGVVCTECSTIACNVEIWNTRPSPWVLVSERLPEDEGRYLCYISNPHLKIAFMEVVGFHQGEFNSSHSIVTHWMLIPDLPELAK